MEIITDEFSDSPFGKWWTENDPLDGLVDADRGLIRRELGLKKSERITNTEDDEILRKHFLLNKSQWVDPVWRPRNWLTNNQFTDCCEVLSRRNMLTSSKLCYRCGQANSGSHALHSCTELRPGESIALDKLFLDSNLSYLEAAKLDLRIAEYNRATLFKNLLNSIVKVHIKGEISTLNSA